MGGEKKLFEDYWRKIGQTCCPTSKVSNVFLARISKSSSSYTNDISANLKNIDIDKPILKYIGININKGILQNININMLFFSNG